MFSNQSSASSRPAYLDNLFRDAPSPSTPSLHSSTSSISCSSTASSYDLRSAFHSSRPLSPAVEEQHHFDDGYSLRSATKSSPNQPRKFRFGRIFSRRIRSTPITATEIEDAEIPPSASVSTLALNLDESTLQSLTRRPSLPLLRSSFPPPRDVTTYAKKPLPAVPRPAQVAQELSCRRCYYYNARNCHGWVMGGTNGDACETCLQAGFFGEK